MRSLLMVITLGCGMVGQVHLRAQEPSPLIQEVLAKHKAARELIRTLSATVRVEATHPKREVLGEGEYWRDGNTVRVRRDTPSGSIIDYRISDGEVRQIVTPGTNKNYEHAGLPGRARRQGVHGFGTRTDAYYELLLTQKDSDGHLYHLEDLISMAVTDLAAKKRRLDGVDCVALSFSATNKNGTSTEFTYWLNPARNYLVQRIDSSSNTGYSSVRSVVAWVEPIPGVIIPASSETTSYDEGELKHRRTAVLSGVVVNEPIPASVMALPPLPRGSLLTDDILGVRGYVDSSWRPIGKMEKYSGEMVISGSTGPDAAEHTSQSQSEPTSTGEWIVIVSLGVLIAGLGVLGYRRYQQAKARRTSEGDAL